jgi:5-oxoprolinase (ATP-hydrolysing)
MFKVGPESVGADPGPVCYGKGSNLINNIDQLAITDANLILNRLHPESFPKRFGLSGNEPINR